jgi:AcrR family transcriptional regulator
MRTSGEDTRARIEKAAIRVFVRKGVAGASIRDIAREARVSLGAIYNHFPSKEDLAWTLFSRSWGQMGTELRERAKMARTLHQQLRAMVRYVFESFDRDWELVTYVYLSRHEHLRHVTGDIPNPHLVFRVMIVEAMARGEIPRREPDVATAMVMGAIVQVIDIKILGRVRGRLASQVDTVAGGCARLLGA